MQYDVQLTERSMLWVRVSPIRWVGHDAQTPACDMQPADIFVTLMSRFAEVRPWFVSDVDEVHLTAIDSPV